jgi:hypothetical protein
VQEFLNLGAGACATKMKRTLIIACMSISLLQASQAADEASLTIEYSWSAFHSQIRTAEIHVQDNGGVTVKYVKQEQKAVEYRFALDENELAAITALVRAVNFFDQQSDTAFPRRVGQSSLTVSLGKERRTLRYGHKPELAPLTQALWRLIQQGAVTTELETKGDTYGAMVASSPLSVGPKVYSPRLLVPPLKRTLGNCQDRQTLEWGLTALAWLLTEDQWLGFVSSQLAEAGDDRKALLLGVLGSHPFYANIPDTHARILLPLLTTILDAFAETKDRISPKTDKAHATICQLLGLTKHEEGIPTLTKVRQAHGDSAAGRWAGWAIESINADKRNRQP